ncbi:MULTISPECIES: hypothetical protein [unclassified Streptomyces]|uniref:hypothetical protein n=1 Tax=unclassified Streptomyces TaxID=2593676 RepID=UPI002E35336E|nr:hypothetical protein [Streptomyces sp. NBC_01280]WSE18785.1 hypothetical protein OG518_38750 [Streptomyces sp. NBC_01397]
MTDDPLIEALSGAVADTAEPVRDEDRHALARLLPLIEERAAAERIVLDEDRRLALAVHALGFVRRVRAGEHLDALDPGVADEITPGPLAAARELIDAYGTPLGHAARDTEVVLLALHFETARQLQDSSAAVHSTQA